MSEETITIDLGNYSSYELADRGERAVRLAIQYGQIDGEHHRLWVIDQMVRALLGNHRADETYTEMVTQYEKDREYSWDTGTAP